MHLIWTLAFYLHAGMRQGNGTRMWHVVVLHRDSRSQALWLRYGGQEHEITMLSGVLVLG